MFNDEYSTCKITEKLKGIWNRHGVSEGTKQPKTTSKGSKSHQGWSFGTHFRRKVLSGLLFKRSSIQNG